MLCWLKLTGSEGRQRRHRQWDESDDEFRGMERGSTGEFQDGQAYSSALAGVQWQS